VQSYAGQMEFGVTVCRRVMSQAEAHELIEHLQAALRDIEALAPADAIEATATAKKLRAKRQAPAKKRSPAKTVPAKAKGTRRSTAAAAAAAAAR
jgi:hypothetical protein